MSEDYYENNTEEEGHFVPADLLELFEILEYEKASKDSARETHELKEENKTKTKKSGSKK